MMERLPWVESGRQAPPMTVPAPLAFFGVLVAYMLGMVMGILIGNKALFMGAHGKSMKLKHHHHHGWGEGPCGKKHGHGHHGHSRDEEDKKGGEWFGGGGEEPQEGQAAPGAVPGESRNEGE